jgi:hypothetical protein
LVPPESGEKGYQNNNSVIKNRFEKKREICFVLLNYETEKFTSFPGEILCSRNVRRQKSVDLEIMFTSVG